MSSSGVLPSCPIVIPLQQGNSLRSRPSLHTVLFPLSEVEGEYRTRRFEVLAGEPTTRTTCTEYGNRLVIDLSLAYFSARLSTERQRIAGLMEEDECVLDMFAGIGPFAISSCPGGSPRGGRRPQPAGSAAHGREHPPEPCPEGSSLPGRCLAYRGSPPLEIRPYHHEPPLWLPFIPPRSIPALPPGRDDPLLCARGEQRGKHSRRSGSSRHGRFTNALSVPTLRGDGMRCMILWWDDFQEQGKK